MCDAVLAPLISQGDLYSARRAAMAHSTTVTPGASPLQWGLPSSSFDEVAARACSEAWIRAVDALLGRHDHLDLIDAAHRQHRSGVVAGATSARPSGCLDGITNKDEWWQTCCSSMSVASNDCSGGASCCAFANASRTFLRIPAIRELWVRVRLVTGREIHVEQDGYLRPFDMPTVLWPAGYLLAQWASDPDNCARWRGGRVLELGAGVGVPSIAAAHNCARFVFATDIAPRSLALTRANAALNGVSATALVTRRFDWEDDTELQQLVRALE